MEEKNQRERGDVVGLLFWKKKCFKVGFERVQRGFLPKRTGRVIPCRGVEDRKGVSTNGGKSDNKESGG